MRRTILLLSAMAFALALVGGAAWAANITGDAGNNKLQGTPDKDNMDGKAGNDTLEGMSGGDSVLGGNGNDLLYGARSDGNSISDQDEVRGQDGNDTVFGSSGADELYGGTGNDAIYDALENDAAVDSIYGGDGDDAINAVSAPAAKDVIYCGSGNDSAEVDSLDVVAGDCETVVDAYVSVLFDEPLSFTEAFQFAEDREAEIVQIEDDYEIGSVSHHDGYVYPPEEDAANMAQAYEEQRLTFFDDMVNGGSLQDLPPDDYAQMEPQLDAMRAALANDDAGQVNVDSMILAGEQQNFEAPTTATASSESSDEVIEQVVVQETSTEKEENISEEASWDDTSDFSQPSDEDPNSSTGSVTTAAAASTFYPNRGTSDVGPSVRSGQRYTLQTFKWSNNNLGRFEAYEHDLKTDNRDRLSYLTGMQTGSPGCKPASAYWESSFPVDAYPYLDTNLERTGRCNPNVLQYTVGVSIGNYVQNDKAYYTYIRTRNGDAAVDGARLRGQVGARDPRYVGPFSNTDYPNGSVRLIDTDNYNDLFKIPSYISWIE